MAEMPFGAIVLQRVLLKPLPHMLPGQLKVASAQREKGQECAAAVAAGQGPPEGAHRRQSRLAIFASCSKECRLFEQALMAWRDPKFWTLVPEEDFNVSFSSLAFRAFSRLVCSTYQVFVVPRKADPIRVFILLDKPELVRELAAERECMLDPFTKEMRLQHRDSPARTTTAQRVQ